MTIFDMESIACLKKIESEGFNRPHMNKYGSFPNIEICIFAVHPMNSTKKKPARIAIYSLFIRA